MRQDYRLLARNSLLLAAVPDAVVLKVLEAAHDRAYDRGETIFLQANAPARSTSSPKVG